MNLKNFILMSKIVIIAFLFSFIPQVLDDYYHFSQLPIIMFLSGVFYALSLTYLIVNSKPDTEKYNKLEIIVNDDLSPLRHPKMQARYKWPYPNIHTHYTNEDVERFFDPSKNRRIM